MVRVSTVLVFKQPRYDYASCRYVPTMCYNNNNNNNNNNNRYSCCLKVMLHGTMFLTQRCSVKNRYAQRDNQFVAFVVQHVAATNVALKIVCRRHVKRIAFLCNNIAL